MILYSISSFIFYWWYLNVVDLSNRFIIDIIFSAGHFVFTRILSSRSYRFNCFDENGMKA